MAKRRVKLTPPTEHPKAEGGWWYYVSGEWSKILESIIEPLYQSYRWEWDNPELAEQAKQWSLEIDRVKELPVVEVEVPVYTQNDCPPLPRGVEIIGNTINIYECENPDMIVNIFGCGCGCGDGATGGQLSGGGDTFGGGQSSGGGASGSWIVESDRNDIVSTPSGITQCDFVTTIIPLIVESMKEVVQVADDNGETAETVIAGLADIASTIPLIGDVVGGFAEWGTAVFATGTASVLSMLLDNDFEFMVQSAWVAAHGNDGRITSVTRQDIFDIVPYLDLTWLQSNVLIFVRPTMNGLIRFLSINKINSRLSIAKNTAQTGLCEYIWAGAGQTYIAPPNQALLTPPIVFNYDWGVRFAGDDLQNGFAPPTSQAEWFPAVGTEGGWGANDGSNALDYFCQLTRSMTGTLTGIRVYLDAPLAGTNNYFSFWENAFTSQYIPADSVSSSVIDFTFDSGLVLSSDLIGLQFGEHDYANNDDDDLTKYILAIEFYGTGTPISGGEAI